MRYRKLRRALPTLALLAAVACADEGDTPALSPIPELAPNAGVFGVGRLVRGWPEQPCLAASYREFDFWVGQWDVTGISGNPAGTNEIEILMDGCVIAESWVGAGGAPGRSINTWDRDTGMWHQTWVAANPVIGPIRMSGGLRGGIMVMDGIRQGGFTLIDHYEWEEIEPDVVVQSGYRDVPEVNLHLAFALTYRRAEDFEPFPITPGTLCQPGGVGEHTRAADFLLGSWRLATAGGADLGQVDIISDLDGCLFDERLEAQNGLRHIAFLYWDALEGAWYRTSIDTEGERMELSGSLEDGVLALTGTERTANGQEVALRYSWEADGTDRVRHRIESSVDGGQRWKEEAELLLLRR